MVFHDRASAEKDFACFFFPKKIHGFRSPFQAFIREKGRIDGKVIKFPKHGIREIIWMTVIVKDEMRRVRKNGFEAEVEFKEKNAQRLLLLFLVDDIFESKEN